MAELPPPRPPSQLGLLSVFETFWCDRYDWLKDAGYQLRSRYHPEWVPSWKGTDKLPISCEDGLSMLTSRIVDATRIQDGRVVIIKQIDRNVHPDEAEIGQYLASPPLAEDPRNNCCPNLAVLDDPLNPAIQLIVMPLLRAFDNPRFITVGEAVEFFRQAFLGLQFMHEHHIAHRDCMTLNIMMDSTPILPRLFHPPAPYRTRDFKGDIHPYTRTARPVRYYWIDFGLSVKFAPDDSNPLALPIMGGDRSVPELRKDPVSLRNPFPTDVYYLGSLVRMEFLQKYTNLTFMEPLVSRMVQDDPEKRPSMDEVVSELNAILAKLHWWKLRSTLVRRHDGWFESMIKGIYYLTARTIPNTLALCSAIPTPKGRDPSFAK